MATTEHERVGPSRRDALRALAAWAGAAAGLGGATTAVAHGAGGHGTSPTAPAEQQAWGIAGDPAAVRRTVDVRMGDDMRFHPAALRVREGETLRLRIRNTGRLMHEFVLGTREALDEHAALMLRFPDMEHDEPHMAHVPPGGTGEIVWHFNRAGRFEFACLIAGHYQSGMRGTLEVLPRGR